MDRSHYTKKDWTFFYYYTIKDYLRYFRRKLSNFIDYYIIVITRDPDLEGFKVTMYCPECHERLHFWGTRRYQTLNEHVCDPNKLPSYKPIFVCVKCTSKAETLGETFYGIEGNLYGKNYRDVKNKKPAIGSFQWLMDKENKKWEQKRKK